MKSAKDKRFARATLLPVLFVLAAVSVKLWVDFVSEVKASDHYIRTFGTIVRFQKREQFRSPGEPSRYYDVPIIQYRTETGEYSKEPRAYRSWQVNRMRVGDRIPIYYDQTNPAKFEPFQRYGPPYAACISSGLLLVAVIVAKDILAP